MNEQTPSVCEGKELSVKEDFLDFSREFYASNTTIADFGETFGSVNGC